MKKHIFAEKRFIYEGGTPGVTTGGNEVYDTPETTVAAAPSLPVAQPTTAEAPKPIVAPEAAKPVPGMPEAPKEPGTPVVTEKQITEAAKQTEERAKRTFTATEQKLATLGNVHLDPLPT